MRGLMMDCPLTLVPILERAGKIFSRVESLRLHALFPDLRDPAQGAQSLRARLLGRHARSDILCDLLLPPGVGGYTLANISVE